MTQNGLNTALKYETVWFDANRYSEAERDYQAYLSRKNTSVENTKATSTSQKGKPIPSYSISHEIAIAREKIKNLFSVSNSSSADLETSSSDMLDRIKVLEETNKALNETLKAMNLKMKAFEDILNNVTSSLTKLKVEPDEAKQPVNADKNGLADSDDDIDLFGSEEETEEDARIKEERVKAYAAKKAKKPALVPKSSVVLDVKPWDDETDMKALETAVRRISTDGLLWGASKLVPLAYSIKKLQIVAVVEDEKVSIDWLQEAIQENEDLVQSVDVAAFNKL